MVQVLLEAEDEGEDEESLEVDSESISVLVVAVAVEVVQLNFENDCSWMANVQKNWMKRKLRNYSRDTPGANLARMPTGTSRMSLN